MGKEQISLTLRARGVSDTGVRREHNEDAMLVDTEIDLFAVADGMGGHQSGDRASSLAIEVLQRAIGEARRRRVPVGRSEGGWRRCLEDAVRAANRTIYEFAEREMALRGMGTTLTALLFRSEHLHVAHVGDSRAYRLREGKLEQLTEDHSWVEEQRRAGLMDAEAAQRSALKHVITRSVGFEARVEAEVWTVGVEKEDCYLICSDGLSNALSGEELKDLLVENNEDEAPERLVAAANEKGGDDNVTAVVVRVA